MSLISETNPIQNWQQTYDYDRWGNRAVRTGSYMPNAQLTPQSAFAGDMSAFNASNNRIAVAGYSYDSSGNVKSDPTTSANAMLYDAENRQVSYTKAGATTLYSYDGDGRRVKKAASSGTTLYVYNAGGQLIAEYATATTSGSGTSYVTTDTLGSTRVVTAADATVKARYDYLPFGEEVGTDRRPGSQGYGGADSTKQKFTSKERDTESGLDYFGARYYSSAQGRFTSPDEFTGGPDELYYFADDAADNPTFYADLGEPQSLNKYQYCYNSPYRYVDPDGHQQRSSSRGRGIPGPIDLTRLTPQQTEDIVNIFEEMGHYAKEDAKAVGGAIKSGIENYRDPQLEYARIMTEAFFPKATQVTPATPFKAPELPQNWLKSSSGPRTTKRDRMADKTEQQEKDALATKNNRGKRSGRDRSLQGTQDHQEDIRINQGLDRAAGKKSIERTGKSDQNASTARKRTKTLKDAEQKKQ